MNRFKLILSLLVYMAIVSQVSAKVKPASIFTDHMVLQQQTNASLWGWARSGATLKITTSWNKQTYAVKTDNFGKWNVKVATPKAGGPYSIIFNDGEPFTLIDILIGEVWLCGGQSNMEMPMKGYKNQPITGSNESVLRSANQNIRLYTVPRWSVTEIQENSKPSEWKVAGPEAVSNFSATGYYFGSLLSEMLNVPIGLINDSYGGSSVEAWLAADDLKPFVEIKVPSKTDTIKEPTRTPTTLYNGMIYPVIGYGVRGMIWYQGESNYDRSDRYLDLFPTLVASWRKAWNLGDFPFYYAQIAPFTYDYPNNDKNNIKLNSAYIRDAQRKALNKISNSGMAVLMDIGDNLTIHPPNKKEVGSRLAYLALAKTYGIKGFGAESPTYESITIDKNKVTAKFQNAVNGLTSFGKELSLFEIAGVDQKFYPAKAVISGSNVTVSSSEVLNPVAIRYAFKNFVKGDLFSNEGLPVSSFRSDDW